MNKIFPIKKLLIIPVIMTSYIQSAYAGWYEVKNYEGNIGNSNVHLSLQTFNEINKNSEGEWHIDGSYYYDAHRIPIILQGKHDKNKNIVLCEAQSPKSIVESPIIPKQSIKNPIPCQIKLKDKGNELIGEWNDGNKTFPIELKQVGSFNDADYEQIHLDGITEIPMWYQNKKYMFLGVYGSSKNCPLAMQSIKLVNKKTGKVDKEIQLSDQNESDNDMLYCQAGMIMTTIYSNIMPSFSENRITLEYRGGKMGTEEEIYIGDVKRKSKKK